MSAGDILIVDDTPGNLDLLVELLDRNGYAVRVARSGRRALAAVAAALPDLVMLDINMPEMDGYEVCERLKADAATRDVPVIFLSVNDEAMDKVRAFQAGGADYVTKPFQSDEVLARVENQLAISRLRSALVAEREEAVKAREEAIEASRAKSVFLANISHELRTPLNAVIGFGQLMECDETLTESQRENLGVIVRSSEHLLALINDVLSLSKIEAGQAVLNVRAFDLRHLLQGIEEMFRMRAANQGLELRFALAPSVPRHALGDDGKLRQILINLLGNAFKFTETGSVRLRASWQDGRMSVEVEDTGYGIAPEELAHIFEPFAQAEVGVRSGEGTGLGLSITRNFVRLMGGEISVRSTPGRGTVFAFDVRLQQSDGQADGGGRTGPVEVDASGAARAAAAPTRERFTALSPEQRARLYETVTAGDREAALRVVAEIETRDTALAGELRAMIRAYRFDDILALIESE